MTGNETKYTKADIKDIILITIVLIACVAALVFVTRSIINDYNENVLKREIENESLLQYVEDNGGLPIVEVSSTNEKTRFKVKYKYEYKEFVIPLEDITYIDDLDIPDNLEKMTNYNLIINKDYYKKDSVKKVEIVRRKQDTENPDQDLYR